MSIPEDFFESCWAAPRRYLFHKLPFYHVREEFSRCHYAVLGSEANQLNRAF
jgi:hypothetical protein